MIAFPGLAENTDWSLVSYRGVWSVNDKTDTIIASQLEAVAGSAQAALDAAEAQAAQLAGLRVGLLAAWNQTFTPGEQAFLKPIFDAAVAQFDAGDIAGAKAIVETAPSISEDLDTKRDSIVALFPA